MNLAEAFLSALEAKGDAVAIREPNGRSVTYEALRRAISALVDDLRARGFQAGDSVVIQVPNGIGFTVATVATLSLGGTAILCEPGLGDEIYLGRLRAASPRWVLVHPIILWANRIPFARRFLRRREIHVPPLFPVSDECKRVILSDARINEWSADSNGSLSVSIEPRDGREDAIVIFTGGTTSLPKGVRLSHRAVGHYLSNIGGIAGRISMKTFLADTPQQVLYGLQLGATVYVTRGRTQRRAAYVIKLLRQGAIDAYFGSPFLWVEMMAQAGADSPPLGRELKAVWLGGAPVTKEFLKSLKQWLHPDTRIEAIYGLTESGPLCVAFGEDKMAWNGEGDFVGAALPGVELSIERRRSEAEPGEVVVRSPSLYTGYLGEPERGEDEGLHTGDLGKLVEWEGREVLVLMGREKDMIIRSSVNVYPTTLEPALRTLSTDAGQPLLRECALIGLWNSERQDEDIVMCYQPAQEVALSEKELRPLVEGVTGEDAAPDFYLEVNPIPVTGRQNKVDKQALRERAASQLGLEPEIPAGHING